MRNMKLLSKDTVFLLVIFFQIIFFLDDNLNCPVI